MAKFSVCFQELWSFLIIATTWVFHVVTQTTRNISKYLRAPHQRQMSTVFLPFCVASPGVPCSEADYKRWSPSDEHGNECLLGREITYKRRAPHATCFNGEDFDRPVTIANCSCTRQDYEWLGPHTRTKHWDPSPFYQRSLIKSHLNDGNSWFILNTKQILTPKPMCCESWWIAYTYSHFIFTLSSVNKSFWLRIYVYIFYI